MVDSEHSLGDSKPSKLSIKEVMKNPEMLKFVPDHLKTKQVMQLDHLKLIMQLKNYVLL